MTNKNIRQRWYLNADWTFYAEKEKDNVKNCIEIPHCPVTLPYNCFDESIYEDIYHYSKKIQTQPEWLNKHVLLTVDGAAHKSKLIINGKEVCEHKCGYTAFTVDISGYLFPEAEENTIEIIIDSHESLNQPPFGNVIDYMTYAGLYRTVYIEAAEDIYFEDVFVIPGLAGYKSEIKLNKIYDEKSEKKLFVKQIFYEGNDKNLLKPVAETEIKQVSGKNIELDMDELTVQKWSIENPFLYTLVTELLDENQNTVDVIKTTIGFRTIKFDETGFYLNGEKIKLRGLNRHQSFPYAGYAMSDSLQKDDAYIIKNKLGCNVVRTSHYPQSQAFIDECDRLGLLVFTEIPGWQHIGENEEWQNQTVENVRDMVCQYRNHPSIIMWGVRINESQDCDELYRKTNDLAHTLDSSRPTAGVRFLKNSSFLEDVYTYNDFVHNGTNSGLLHKKAVTKSKGGYLVSEYCGHMYPVKSFDNEALRTQLALRHAKILNDGAAFDEIGGTIGWCAFDYQTHNDFGSGDRICYHGVMDMFRNPKMAAYVYSSQKKLNSAEDVVLELSTDLHIGDYPAGTLGEIWAFTNAPAIKIYDNGEYVKTYTHADSPFKNLLNPPILIDDMIGNRLSEQDGINPFFAPMVKKLLFVIRKYTVDKVPFKYKLLFAFLMICGVINPSKMEKLYFKYMGSWGGNSRECSVVALDSNGNELKCIKRGARVKKVSLSLTALRNTLCFGSTYDSAEINICAVDENGNIQHYCQEPFTVNVDGPVCVIGPAVSSLKGGMGGVYIRTTGEEGKAKVSITDWNGERYSLDFTVEKDNSIRQL